MFSPGCLDACTQDSDGEGAYIPKNHIDELCALVHIEFGVGSVSDHRTSLSH